ncbi:MAG: hypothetical protein KF681_04260 [Bdellovibrionaceae bacterium]|nr:hypothetical protein [Pseudobdellovibrionaceae bacterium]
MTKFFALLTLVLLTASCTTAPKPAAVAQVIPPPSPSRYPACGAGPAGLQVRGNAAFAKTFVGKSIICKIGDNSSYGTLGEFALYRCMGSPSYLSLQTYGQTRMIELAEEGSQGSINLTSSNVANEALMPSEMNRVHNVSEKINCEFAESFAGDRSNVLNPDEFSCSKQIIRAIWSKFIADYHSKKQALGLNQSVGDLKFEIIKMQNGSYTARNLSIDGQAFPLGTGSAKVESGCKVTDARAAIN